MPAEPDVPVEPDVPPVNITSIGLFPAALDQLEMSDAVVVGSEYCASDDEISLSGEESDYAL